MRVNANLAADDSVGASVVEAEVVVVAACGEVAASGSAEVVGSADDPPHAASMRIRTAGPTNFRVKAPYAA